MRSLFAAALIIAAAPCFAAPSFDCSKATDPVDKIVCSDNALAAADAAMAAQYARLIATGNPQKPNFILLQRAWLRQRSKTCDLAATNAAVCLRTLYERRRDFLSNVANNTAMKTAQKGVDASVRDDAIQLMVNEPRTAEKVLRTDPSLEAKAGLAMVLGLTGDNPAAHKGEIDKLFAEIAAKGDNKDLLEDNAHYDGSAASMTPFIQAVGEVDIPCAMIARHPDLINALNPYYGSTRDNFLPHADCEDADYPIPASVQVLAQAVYAYDGGAFDRCTGTLRFMYNRSTYVADVTRRVIPRWLVRQTLAQSPVPEWTKLDATPLQQWSYLGPWNRAAYFRVRTIFFATRKDLAETYQRRFAMAPKEALVAAHIALWSDYAGWTWGRTNPAPIAVAIMEKDAKPSLSDLLAAKTATTTEPEPALSLAVARPEAIGPLLAAHADVNARNPIGKTPLMTAAQFNNAEAVRAFLKAGAQVYAVTAAPDAIEDNSPVKEDDSSSGCTTYAISNGNRTALIYAAANASLEVITTLVKAGADIRMRDSQGKTALDYLEGRGPVPKNPVLSPSDFDKARRALTP